MNSDRAEAVVDAGDATRTYEVVASGAGRRVETAGRRAAAEVSEVTLPSMPRLAREPPVPREGAAERNL